MKNETDEKNKCYINRELSWLKFNDRVLEEAADEENPLCERLSFLSIFQTNLDEFFMVRVGSLHDMQFLKKEVRDNKTGMTPQEQIEAILQTTALMARRKDQVYMDLMGLLTDQGIRVVSFSALNDIEKKQLERYFEQEIKPLLSTIIVGKKQPFPFLQTVKSMPWQCWKPAAIKRKSESFHAPAAYLTVWFRCQAEAATICWQRS